MPTSIAHCLMLMWRRGLRSREPVAGISLTRPVNFIPFDHTQNDNNQIKIDGFLLLYYMHGYACGCNSYRDD